MSFVKFLTLKKLGEGGQFHPALWFFQKCIFWREGEALVFVTFIIVMNYIFRENFIEIPHIAEKI